MGLIQGIFANESVSTLESPTAWLLDWFRGRKTTAGTLVSPQGALALSAYYACQRNIAEDLGKIPPFVFKRRETQGRDKDFDHPVHKLLRVSANAEMSSQVFIETMTAWAVGWGNGYAEIRRSGAGVPIELWPLHPFRVLPKRYPNGELYYSISNVNAISSSFLNPATQSKLASENIDPFDILHVHGLASDGVTGYSIAQIGAESIGEGLALQDFGSTFFANALVSNGVLESAPDAKKQGPDRLKMLREQWDDRAKSKERHKPIILDPGMKWVPLSIPNDQAQWIESRQFKVEEIARWFRMPLSKIQHHLRAQGWSTLEQLNTDYVVDTLTPWAVRWESEIQRKLFRESETDHYAKFQFNSLMRGDQRSRGEFMRTLVNIGALSPNDVLDLEDMNPYEGEGGDEHYMQSNMATLEQIAKGENQKTAQPFGKRETDFEQLQPVILDTVRRLCSKEIKAFDRAKGKNDREGMRQWAALFYEKHEDYAYSLLWPPWSLTGADDATLRDICRKNCAGFRDFAPECESLNEELRVDYWIISLKEGLQK